MFYAVAIPAVILTGISKSGLGGGLGQLSVPLMAMFISPVAAAAIMLPILCLMDIANLWGYRNHWNREDVALMLPGAVIGIGVGAVTYNYVDDNAVRLLLGVITIIFATSLLFQNSANSESRKPGKLTGVICGTISGFTSFVAHAGGPPVHVYLLPQRIDKTLYVGTLVVFFTAVNYTKLVPYALLGQLSANNLGTSLVLSPLAPLGIWMGVRFHRLLSERLFYTLCYVFLSLTGVKLIWDGLLGMIGG